MCLKRQFLFYRKPDFKVSKYDQEIPQSQTTDQHMTPRGRGTEQRQRHNSIIEKQPALSLSLSLSLSPRWLQIERGH